MNRNLAKHPGILNLLQAISSDFQVTQQYHIHDIVLEIVSNSQEVLTQFNGLFGCFAISGSILPPLLQLHIYTLPSQQELYLTLPKAWTLYGKTEKIACYVWQESFFYLYGAVSGLLLNMTEKYGIGYIKPPYSSQKIQQICRDLFFPSLSIMLWFHEVFPLHASAVARTSEKGILILGVSGRGKTTLLLHLLKKGFHYMADDAVFIRKNGSGVKILFCPTAVRVTPDMIRFFPEFQSLIRNNSLDEYGKYTVDIMRISHLPPLQTAKPVLLLFPEVTGNTETSIEQVSRMAAAVECLPQNILVSNTETSKNNFDMLSRLIRSTRCYRVRLGKDMSSLGQQIDALVRNT